MFGSEQASLPTNSDTSFFIILFIWFFWFQTKSISCSAPTDDTQHNRSPVGNIAGPDTQSIPRACPHSATLANCSAPSWHKSPWHSASFAVAASHHTAPYHHLLPDELLPPHAQPHAPVIRATIAHPLAPGRSQQKQPGVFRTSNDRGGHSLVCGSYWFTGSPITLPASRTFATSIFHAVNLSKSSIRRLIL